MLSKSTEEENSSVNVSIGVGSTCVSTTKGVLCGRGDMSIDSYRGPGEEEGGGGVVTLSVCGLANVGPIHVNSRTSPT